MIRFTVLAEFTIIALIALFVIYQVIAPILLGTPVFPILREKRRDALNDLRNANADLEVAQLRAEARNTRERTFPVEGVTQEAKPKKKINK